MNSTAENRLARESSPYLRQHANNPVDWYPWGAEALARAQAEGKTIFLSIGYAACHWCHVMERESFEDPAIAELLNANFVNIKVDREERPDVDQIYMAAVVAMTRHGGWPMSVFLTPDQRPFYAGTYFPPEDRYGMPSFRRVLQGVISAWQNRREEVLTSAEEITAHLRDAASVTASDTPVSPELLRGALHQLRRTFDPQYGGFGQAPKFPHPLEIRLLFRCWQRFQDETAKEMALQTLDRMAAGGIYDQLGGGFHRYSTDARWLAPHFEKMLYDNALLVPAYLDAYLITKEPRYRRVVEETLAWVEREMTHPEGAFYSTLDADSEGEEGKFYVWSQAEVENVLGADAEFFASIYDVSASGNWEGHNILHRPKTDEQDARLQRITADELRSRLDPMKVKLLAARAKRIRPGLDDKYLTAWNGLMISAFAQVAQVMAAKYAKPASRAMDFVLERMRAPNGQLYRTASPNQPAKLNGYLEDYSFILNALADLYEADFDRRWIEEAAQLTDVMIDQFWDEAEGGFFFVGKDHESLILRNKEPQDNAVPSGNSVAALVLLRLGKLCDRSEWTAKADRTLALFSGLMAQQPMAFGQMLAAVDFQLGPVREYVVVGGESPTATDEALAAIRAEYQPNRLMLSAAAPDPAAERLLPLLRGKHALQGEVTTYRCVSSTCEAPLVGVAALQCRLAANQS